MGSGRRCVTACTPASLTPSGLAVLTRRFSRWLPVDNEDHCDFRKLRSLLLRVHMLDLVTTTEETHYEAYRQTQMETRKFGEPKVKKLDNPKFKEEEELLRKRFTEQVKMEEARFRQWEQHVSIDIALASNNGRRGVGRADPDDALGNSSSPNETGSTRTSRTLIRPSSRWRRVERVSMCFGGT